MRTTLRAEAGSIGSDDTLSRVYHDRTLVVIGIARYVVVVEGKRRLPLLPSAGGEVASARPAWQWIALGATAIFVAWVPLAAAAPVAAGWAEGPLSRLSSADASSRDRVVLAILSSLALALSAFAGGFVIGKARGAATALREAALSGLAAAFVAVVGSWMTLGFNLGSLVAVAMAVAFSAIGGKVGQPRSEARGRAGAAKR